MIDCKCSFTATLIKGDFGCEMAQMVTRRAGPDIACASEDASNQCENLLSEFKSIGLPAFDAEDDLLTTPHSVFAKIQYGGLLGMARDLNDTIEIERIDNIYGLIGRVLKHYGSIDNVPHHEYLDSMVNYKIKRKKRTR